MEFNDRVFKITKKKVDESVLHAMWKEIRGKLASSRKTHENSASNSMISHLVLYRNELGDEMVYKLCEGIKEFQIIALHIWANSLTDISAIVLSRSLAFCCIETLDLSRNHITDIGALSIAKNLKNSSLSSLDLSHNPVSDAGLISILRNLDLFHLHLIGCEVTQKGADYLIDMLQSSDKCPGDVKLLDNVKISLETHVMIEMALERHRLVQKKAAQDLVKFAQVFYRIHLPLPVEIKDMILDTQIDAHFCKRDKKLLKSVIFSPIFRGWIKSVSPFSREELLRTCRFLLMQRNEFVKLKKLRDECREVSKMYFGYAKKIDDCLYQLKWIRIYQTAVSTIDRFLGPFGFAIRAILRTCD